MTGSIHDVAKHTTAWVAQVWISFAFSFGMTLIGIWQLSADMWVKGFLGMGLLFSIGSAFQVAKTVRDNHEAQRYINRLNEAKSNKLISEYELRDAA